MMACRNEPGPLSAVVVTWYEFALAITENTMMINDMKIVLNNELNMVVSPEKALLCLLSKETLAHRDDMRASLGVSYEGVTARPVSRSPPAPLLLQDQAGTRSG